MVALFDSWIQALGPWGFLVVGLAAMLEYVFPPFPGDSVVLLGGVYAVRGERSAGLVFAAIIAGSVIGAALDYGFGRLLAGRLDRRPQGGRVLGVSMARIRALQGEMRRRGDVIILFNRFVPGVRSLLFVAAGAARMPLGRVLLLGAVSAMAWNVLLFGAGLAVGGNAERLEALFHEYQAIVLGLLALLGVVLLVRFLLRVRRRPTADKAR